MQTIKVDKVGSVAKSLKFSKSVDISSEIPASDGVVIAVRSLTRKKKYGELELSNGRFAKISKGDVIIGALGERKALEGIVGSIPANIKVGDTLEILNLGGVIGKAESWNKDFVPSPIQVEVLGAVHVDGKVSNLHTSALKLASHIEKLPPLIVVIGTAMNTGKTTVATETIRLLSRIGKQRVGAAKITGVATQRDVLSMRDAGAIKTMSFQDVGLTSTINHKGRVVPAAKTILNTLAQEKVDSIVVECGDGIIGWYGIDKLLRDQEFRNAISFVIFCAHDVVGAFGGYKTMKRLGVGIDYFAGPVTNNTAGTDYLEEELHVPSQDIRDSKEKLALALKKKKLL